MRHSAKRQILQILLHMLFIYKCYYNLIVPIVFFFLSRTLEYNIRQLRDFLAIFFQLAQNVMLAHAVKTQRYIIMLVSMPNANMIFLFKKS